MEQITREEMIGLLEGLYNKLMDVTECLECCGRMGPECCGSPEPRVPDDVLQLVDKARQYAAALQAAEPAMVIDVGRGVHGTPAYEKLFFNESLENGRHELFTLPCPPAKAQVPDEQVSFEEWARTDPLLGEHELDRNPEDSDDYDNLFTQAAWNAWQARAMLTASPAPDHSGDDGNSGWISVRDRQPSEIWLEPVDHEADPDMGRSWCVHPLDCDECGAESVRYVRADISEACVKKMEAARDSWRRVCESLAREKLKVETENLSLTKTLVEMKADNAELRKFIEAKMHHLPIEDQHVASVMIQQADDEGEA